MTRTARSLLAAGALALAAACGGAEQQRAPDTPAAREVDSTEALAFMAAIDQTEIEAAQRGARRANTTEVRRFAQLLWREHAQSGRDLAELARQMEIDLRAAAPQSRLIANLRAMSQQTTQLLDRTPRSPEFDRAYIESQVRGHQAVLRDLRRIIAADSARRANASVAPGGGVDVGVTGRIDAADSAAAARRAASRKPENAQDALRITLARVQQHLDSARRLQAWLGAGSSPPPPSNASAPRRRE